MRSREQEEDGEDESRGHDGAAGVEHGGKTTVVSTGVRDRFRPKRFVGKERKCPGKGAGNGNNGQQAKMQQSKKKKKTCRSPKNLIASVSARFEARDEFQARGSAIGNGGPRTAVKELQQPRTLDQKKKRVAAQYVLALQASPAAPSQGGASETLDKRWSQSEGAQRQM
ncbi:hypothetical protein NM208_g14595 [Fusarium decemcellulare]|uniref:Uncharacterized protein n=1 Tax=Fusarium decemcellulare TaxID=57161 RepID=A0ACC1RFG7_9HYPO|nr:hypothetical protein NM208_g14595 [Fusarium decemcellulare]